MNAALFFLILFIHVHAGYFVLKQKTQPWMQILFWIETIASVVAVHAIFLESVPLLRMLVLIVATLIAMKNVVTVAYYPAGSPLSYPQWLCFTLGWFGMRPNLFAELRFSNPDFQKHKHFLLKGVTRIIGGCILIMLSLTFIPDSLSLLKSLMVLIGLSLILHFGILNIQTWWWNCWGARCQEIFRAPLKSKSLNEFWGKRWNMAFSEMTSLAVYRPVKKALGNKAGIVAAFIFSGLLHEMAISLPVMTGFGLPLLYFVVHGILMQMEEHVGWVKRITSHKVAAHAWVLFWLVIPMPLLFHKAFVSEILLFISSLYR